MARAMYYKIQYAMTLAKDYSDMLNSMGITNFEDQETVISYLSSLINIAFERSNNLPKKQYHYGKK